MYLKHFFIALLVFMLSALLAVHTQAQDNTQGATFAGADYTHALGLRFGFYSGITYKQYVTTRNAFELIGATQMNNRYACLVGIYQWDFGLAGVAGLSWHMGPGLHVNIGLQDEYTIFTLGADLNGGLEYKFAGIPFTAGLDYNIGINVVGERGMQYDGLGLSLRYTW